jgi:hypothetical protein
MHDNHEQDYYNERRKDRNHYERKHRERDNKGRIRLVKKMRTKHEKKGKIFLIKKILNQNLDLNQIKNLLRNVIKKK